MKVLKLEKGNQEKVIQETLKVLKKGELVIYPTETCYGLGVDATNRTAVLRLLKYKGERGGKPISVAVGSVQMAHEYVEINATAENLYQKFLPGPLTVISKSKGKVVSLLEGPNFSLGIRLPDYPLILKIQENLTLFAGSINP